MQIYFFIFVVQVHMKLENNASEWYERSLVTSKSKGKIGYIGGP